MSTAKYFDTTHELELLSQLNEMVSKGADRDKIDEVKEQLVDYLIKTLAYADMLYDSDKDAELLEGDNVKLLKFLCNVDTPKIKRKCEKLKENENVYDKITWFSVYIGEGENKSRQSYGIMSRIYKMTGEEEYTQLILEEY